MARRPTALGASIYAGGFTVGVKEHFEVLGVLEESKYGVATHRHNHPEIPVTVGVENWAPATPADVDFIYGNPPCAAWSAAGGSNVRKMDWRLDSRVDCTRRHFQLLEKIKPRFWVWESVTEAFTKGRELVDNLTARALDLGYSVTYILHNSAYLGVPQVRKRFFFVAHQLTFDVEDYDQAVISCDEALRRLNDPGEPLDHNLGRHREILHLVKPGEQLRTAFERAYPERLLIKNKLGQVVGRPPFTILRLKPGLPAPVVMHEMVHPTEHRGLSIKELATLCGYPPGYEFIGANDAGQVGRGVCPPVAEWLARNVARYLARGEREPPTVRLIDVREPPGSTTVLERPMKTEVQPLVVPPEEASGSGDRRPPAIAGAPLFDEYGPDLRIWRAPKLEIDDLSEYGAPITAPTTVATPAIARAPNLERLSRGSGARIRELILAGGRSVNEILEIIHAEFEGRKTKASDVHWNLNRLRKEGHSPPPFTGSSSRSGAPPTVAAVAPPLEAPPPGPSLTSGPGGGQHPLGERQSNDPKREFDRSSLRAGSHGQWIHRDYLAHVLRWGFAGRYVTNETDVLDVGCGPDVPMIDVLTMPRNQVPRSYVGVDLNREPRKHPTRQWATLRWEFDFLERANELGQFDLVTNFEMIEHMRKPEGLRLLAALRDRLRPDGLLLLSTPVFNGKAAKNHLHEWTIPELGAAITSSGLAVIRRFGTFASKLEVRKVASAEELRVVDRLGGYFSDEVLACLLAPLYPDASRNNLWVLRRAA